MVPQQMQGPQASSEEDPGVQDAAHSDNYTQAIQRPLIKPEAEHARALSDRGPEHAGLHDQ